MTDSFCLGPICAAGDSPLGGFFHGISDVSAQFQTGYNVSGNAPQVLTAYVEGDDLSGIPPSVLAELASTPPKGGPGAVIGNVIGAGVNVIGSVGGQAAQTAGPGVGAGVGQAAAGVGQGIGTAATVAGPGVGTGLGAGLAGVGTGIGEAAPATLTGAGVGIGAAAGGIGAGLPGLFGGLGAGGLIGPALIIGGGLLLFVFLILILK